MRAKLSGAARRDLDEIRRFTIERWGREQWLKYFSGLQASFARIAGDSQCGRPRDTLAAGLRSLTHEQHVIFFGPVGPAGGSMVIVRIVHQRRNFAALSLTDDLEG
jgi:toxin ParE1/3/4